MEESIARMERRRDTVRKWHCSQCPTQFLRRDHLLRHNRTHTRARPFVCTHCSKTFSRHDVLLRHNAQVHEIVRDSDAFEGYTARHVEPSPDRSAPRTPSSSSPLSVPSDLDELFAICSDPRIWTSGDMKTGRSPRDSASRDLAITRPLPTGEYTDDWRSLNISTAHSPTLLAWMDLTGEFPRPKVNDSLAASGALGVPQADLDFLLGLHHSRGQTDTVMSHDRMESIGANGHVNRGSDTTSPLADTAHGLGKCLDTPKIEALFSIYTVHFMPNLPFIHYQTLDLYSALNAEFPKVNQRLSSGTSGDGSQRPFYKSLFLAMLSHGAAYTAQPVLARRLHMEATKAIQSDLSALTRMGETKVPLHIIQAMIHQIHLGFSFGDLRLEDYTLSHVYSLMALVKDAMLFQPPTHARARLSNQSVQTHNEWLDWVEVEERKRTFFAVMVIMSASITMFNFASYMDVQSIQLALPCQEFLWEAETVRAFRAGISMNPEAPPLFQDEYSSLFKRDEDLVDCHSDTHCHTGFMNDTCGGTSCGCDLKENLSGFGCLILISALSQTIWKWNRHRKNGSNDDLHARDVFSHALNRWRARWKSLEAVSFKSPHYRLLISCMPILDHVELMLKVDITSAKEALHHRRYDDVGAYVDMMELHSNHNNSVSSRSIDKDFLNAYDLGHCYTNTDDTLLYDAALYSAKALQLSMQKGPWWSCKNTSVDLPLHTAVIAFHCTQILCTWLLFLQEKISTQNSAIYRPDSEVENDDMLLGLCRKLAQHSLSRLDNNLHIQQNFNDDAMSLALALAQALANFFQKQSAWPVLHHLATSLQVRVRGILDRAHPLVS